MKRCLEEGFSCTGQRLIYAKPVLEIRVIQWHLAAIYIDYEASTWLLYYSAWLREVDEENALSEYVATESAVRCARRFLDIYNHVRKRGFSLVNRGMEIFEKPLDLLVEDAQKSQMLL